MSRKVANSFEGGYLMSQLGQYEKKTKPKFKITNVKYL